MADNVTLDSMSGGEIVATDQDTGANSEHYQKVKMVFGADGTFNLVTSTTTNPLPVALSDTDNAVLDTIDAVLDTIKVDTEAIETAVEIVDNAVHVDDAAFTLGTDSGIMMMGFAGTQSVDANDAGAIAIDTDGAVQVSDGGNSLTVDGTVTANLSAADNAVLDTIDAVLDTIKVDTEAIETAVEGTLTIQEASAMDVSAATVTVDLGANNDVTIDNSSVVYAEDTASQAADPGVLVLARRTATPADTSGADLDYETLQMDNGRLWASATIDAALPAGDNNIGNVDIVSGTVTAVTDITNTIDSTISGAALTALQLIDDVVYAEDVASQAADPGVAVYGVRDDALAANAGVGADGDYLPFRMNNDGALWAQLSAGNLGGCKMFNDIDLDEADIDVATGACTVYAIYAVNTTAAPLHLKLFNTNTVTMGTTAATASLVIPANADSDGAGFVLPIPACGLAFSTALTVAVTTGVALDDNGAPGANAAIVTILYQD